MRPRRSCSRFLGRHGPIEDALNHVRDVRVHAGDGGAVTDIEVVGTQAPVYQARTEAQGRRLIVDLSHADVVGAPEALTGTSGLSGGVLTTAFESNGSMTRVAVNFAKDATYRIKPDGATLHILLYPALGSSSASTLPAIEKVGAKTEATAELAQVRFERRPESGQVIAKDRVIIGVTAAHMPAYSLDTTASGRARLVLHGTSLPEALVRTFDVAQYHGSLRTITTFKDDKTSDCIIEIDRYGSEQGTVEIEGDKIVWSFDVPTNHVASPIGGAGRTRTVAREDEPADVPKVLTSIHQGEDGVQVQTAGGGEAGFAQTVAEQGRGPLHGPAHRSRPQGRRRPQHPAFSRRHRAREHRHRRRRVGQRSRSACATCPGTRHSTSSRRRRVSGWCGRAT